MSNGQATAGTIATVATGLFAGAALGISLFDQAAHLDDDPSGASAAKRFPAMYKRAAPVQGGLALVGAAAAAAAAAQGGKCSRVIWGGSGALLLSVWPFTLFVMKPVNDKLLGNAPLAAGDEKGALARRWGRLHAYRAAASTTALCVMAVGLARLSPHGAK